MVVLRVGMVCVEEKRSMRWRRCGRLEVAGGDGLGGRRRPRGLGERFLRGKWGSRCIVDRTDDDVCDIEVGCGLGRFLLVLVARRGRVLRLLRRCHPPPYLTLRLLRGIWEFG